MEPDLLNSVFENAPFGFAHHEVIYDKKNKPVDYIFLKINKQFELITGLKENFIIGKRVTGVIPDITSSKFDWIGFYGKIALEGTTESFEQYFEPLKKWFQVQVFSHKKGFFSVFFINIDERKKQESILKESEAKYKKLEHFYRNISDIIPDLI